MLRTFRWQSLIHPLLVRLKCDAGDFDVALGRSLLRPRRRLAAARRAVRAEAAARSCRWARSERSPSADWCPVKNSLIAAVLALPSRCRFRATGGTAAACLRASKPWASRKLCRSLADRWHNQSRSPRGMQLDVVSLFPRAFSVIHV